MLRLSAYSEHEHIVGVNSPKQQPKYSATQTNRAAVMKATLWEDLLELGPECYERFLNNENVPELRSLGIHVAGVSQLQGRYWVARRSPNFHTLLFTLEGQGKLFTPAGEHTIEANTLTLLPVGKAFRFTLNAQNWSTAWFCLEDSPAWAHLKKQASEVHYCTASAAIYYLLCQLYYEADATMRESPTRQLRQYLQQALSATPRIGSDRHNPHRRLQTLFNELQQQLHVDWSVADMADRIHYSVPHLHRLCKHVYGQSPLQRLIALRMARAQQLLSDSNWSLAQIASTLGYQDVFNFSNRFKKVVGIAPSQYRQQQKQTK